MTGVPLLLNFTGQTNALVLWEEGGTEYENITEVLVLQEDLPIGYISVLFNNDTSGNYQQLFEYPQHYLQLQLLQYRQMD